MELENPAANKDVIEIQSPSFTVEPPKPNQRIEIIQILWKVFLFLLIAMEIGPALTFGVGISLFGSPHGALSPGFLLFLEVGNFGILLGLSRIMSFVESRQVSDYGIPLKNAFGGNFWTGWLLGLAEASVLVGLILVFGGYSFGDWALHGREILLWGLLHLVLFLFVGLYEEFLFRGYVQFTLSKWVGFWPAALMLSLGFGAVHLHNRGESWVGAASVTLVGLLFAFTLQRSGNLWYAIGLHAGFDWGETFLYSVPDSGEMLSGHLSSAVLHGPRWLTGGTVGPEGSVFCFLTMGLQFLVGIWLFPKKAAERNEETAAAAD